MPETHALRGLGSNQRSQEVSNWYQQDLTRSDKIWQDLTGRTRLWAFLSSKKLGRLWHGLLSWRANTKYELWCSTRVRNLCLLCRRGNRLKAMPRQTEQLAERNKLHKADCTQWGNGVGCQTGQLERTSNAKFWSESTWQILADSGKDGLNLCWSFREEVHLQSGF